MALNSTIEWTEATWNPVSGCSKVSPGCAHCYAERMALRLQAMGQKHYKCGFKVAIHEDSLELPMKWKTKKNIFVNSMGDLFHEDVPDDFIIKVFTVMSRASWHQFQVLTKRSSRLRLLSPRLPWAENIWMGVSVETEEFLHRVADLSETGAAVKFVSFEPLLGDLPSLSLKNVNWAIVGGESGPGARLMHPSWVKSIQVKCSNEGVPFFFKQWGGSRKKKAGRYLEGRLWCEMPGALEPAPG